MTARSASCPQPRHCALPPRPAARPIGRVGRRVRAGRLIPLFFGVFGLGFGWLVTHIVVNGGWSYYGCQEIWLLVCTGLALGLLAGLWRLMGRHQAALARQADIITVAFLAAMAVAQLALGWRLRYRPVFDIDAIFGGAVEWVETGSFSSYTDYYCRFFNNFGGLRFLYWIIRLADGLGIRDRYFAAMAANGLLSVATMFVTGQAAKKRLGVRGQMMAYALFAVSPPFYFIAPAFYTDALSMLFPVLTYWLWLLAREQPRRRARLGLYGLMGLAASLGAQIKATVVIAFIAILMDGMLTWDRRRTAAMAALVLTALLLGQAGLEHTIYQHLDRAQAEQQRIPLLHWVMMGLTGNGMYNSDDYAFTQSFTDRAEQSAALKAEIKSRLEELGPDGLVRLLALKGNIIFGDGTYGLSDCLGGEPLTQTGLREWLLPGGSRSGAYRHICTGVLLALYILMAAAALADAFSPHGPPWPDLVPRLALFGLAVFLLCWEARWRYFSNYVPMIFLAALPGLETITKSRTSLKT